MNPPGGRTRAWLSAALAVVLAAAGALKHRQNETWRAAERRSQTPSSEAAWQKWVALLRSLKGQPPERVVARVTAAGDVRWDYPSPRRVSGNLEERTFVDRAGGWSLNLRFRDGLLTSSISGSSFWSPAEPSPAEREVELGRAAVYRKALWVSVAALGVVFLIALFAPPVPGHHALLAWRRPLTELGLAAAVVGLVAYALAPDAHRRFSGQTAVRDEFLQTHFWMLAAGILFLWMLRPRPPRTPAPLCPACGYNLTGNVSGVCPECGTPARGRNTPVEVT